MILHSSCVRFLLVEVTCLSFVYTPAPPPSKENEIVKNNLGIILEIGRTSVARHRKNMRRKYDSQISNDDEQTNEKNLSSSVSVRSPNLAASSATRDTIRHAGDPPLGTHNQGVTPRLRTGSTFAEGEGSRPSLLATFTPSVLGRKPCGERPGVGSTGVVGVRGARLDSSSSPGVSVATVGLGESGGCCFGCC